MDDNIASNWVLIPVKPLNEAKTRLASLLQLIDRARLAQAMFEDVLWATRRAPGVAGIMVVTQDVVIRRLANSSGAKVCEEGSVQGHNRALSKGAAALRSPPVGAIVVLPADIPLLTPGDVTALLDSQRKNGGVIICPDHHQRGTNALVLPHVDAIPFCFGEDSYYRHRREAVARGYKITLIDLPRIAQDVDTSVDLQALLASGVKRRTGEVLTRLRIDFDRPDTDRYAGQGAHI